MDAASTPLLMSSHPVLIEETVDQNLSCNEHHDSPERTWRPILSEVAEEIKQIYTISLPLIITGLLIYGKSVISMLFLGKLGKSALAGGSLSLGIANITGYSIISGLSMGMDAIASQAHGAHKFSLMTQTLHRTIAILLATTIPITILWFNAEPLLLLAGQDPAISAIAGTYLVFTIPSLIFQSFISPLKVYLRAKNVTSPLLAATAFALTFHAGINYLVYHLGHGIKGIALAVGITDFVLLSTLLLYLHSSSGISVKSFDLLQCFMQWKPILSLAIPSCLSVCLEWWYYELMIILSGLLPTAAEAVSTMGILLQATSLVYIFPSALSLAVSARVGNELGANRPQKARAASQVALLCAVLTSFIAMAFMITTRHTWGRTFTMDKAILSLTATVMPVVGLCELGNCLQTTGCGVLRGCARPALGAFVNLGSFYCVGLPVAAFMGFILRMGLLGLSFGLMAAQASCSLLIIFFVWRTNWEKETDRAQLLIGMDEDET